MVWSLEITNATPPAVVSKPCPTSKLRVENAKRETQNWEAMLRSIVTVLGIVLAAFGGVVAYRALFVDPASAVVISEEGIRQLPDTFRVVGGVALLLVGAALALTAALRKPKSR